MIVFCAVVLSSYVFSWFVYLTHKVHNIYLENTAQPTKHTSYYTLYTNQCKLYSAHSILNTAHSTGCSFPRDSRITDASISGSCFRPSMWRGHCTLYSVQCTLYTLHCISVPYPKPGRAENTE